MSKTTFDIREIMQMLAHRYPFLLVDKVIDHERGKSVTAVKNVTANEPFFQGHFPGVPTMPGVLILEAMAQTCGILTSQQTGITVESGVIFYFAGIDNARFKRIVIPGDQLVIRAEVDKVKRNLWKFKATATVEGELACEADLLCIFKDKPKSQDKAEKAEVENTVE